MGVKRTASNNITDNNLQPFAKFLANTKLKKNLFMLTKFPILNVCPWKNKVHFK